MGSTVHKKKLDFIRPSLLYCGVVHWATLSPSYTSI